MRIENENIGACFDEMGNYYCCSYLWLRVIVILSVEVSEALLSVSDRRVAFVLRSVFRKLL